MISINGVTLPSPTKYQVYIQDLSKGERNVNGLLLLERIATKRKIDLSWKMLSPSQYATILRLVSPVFFNVQYQDPEDATTRSGTFYAGDRSIGALNYTNGIVQYNELSFSIIER
ncbi:DUF6711 family protein [Paenibacillus riograndensis]|uniref:Uncharacterized protein n=1 Tax=Paenibacillus riograndensis SBR5 TaxID=1073571 RepID=A0A0E4H781_9BACL|nr:DUF6711 family protein [Paenibacillus riograndensis]CQR51486.1 hypothetical protein PRIO_0232 [Paenibacillus riograndensis SBR5]